VHPEDAYSKNGCNTYALFHAGVAVKKYTKGSAEVRTHIMDPISHQSMVHPEDAYGKNGCNTYILFHAVAAVQITKKKSEEVRTNVLHQGMVHPEDACRH
jgi:hypothetical protein